MIIIFHVTDAQGTVRRLSAVCAPSTTAAGAINIFRTRVGVPNTVKVEVQLENSIPIRHQTAPLTSLRKQRGGVTHVMQILLWVVLAGAADEVAAVDLSKLDDAGDDDDSGDENVEMESSVLLEEMGPSWTARGERRHSMAAAGGGGRIMKGRAADDDALGSTRRGAAVMSVRISRPSPLTARDPRPARGDGVEPLIPVSVRQGSPSPSKPPAQGGGTERVTKTNPHAAGAAQPPQSAAASKPASRAASKTKEAEEKYVEEGGKKTNNGSSKEALADPAAAAATAADDEEEECAVAPPLAGRGHTVRRDSNVAQLMIREYPRLMDPADSRQIATLVRDDDRQWAMSYDPRLVVPSAIDGVSDADYSRFLSAGLVHGVELRSAQIGHRIALYGAINSLKHSCRPNAAVHLDFYTEPHSASCRCAVVEGLRKGDEISYLYRHADSQAFLLLSRERRQTILSTRYFFTCECPRCQYPIVKRKMAERDEQQRQQERAPAAGKRKQRPAKKTEGDGEEEELTLPVCSPPIPQVSLDAEATLTGCFFTDSSYDTDAAKQDAISAEMKADFDALQIMSDDGLDITLTVAGNVPPTTRTKQCNRLLQFIRRYGSAEAVLKLHEHHWRLNMVRAAYIQETVRLCAIKGVTPEARRREPESKKLFTPTRTVYDLCLKQLAVEGLFIPAGHPHGLTTYESFLYLVAILPPSLAGAVMAQARATSRVNWRQLQETKAAWGLLKRAAIPPAVMFAKPVATNAPAAAPAPAAASGGAVPATPRTTIKRPMTPRALIVKSAAAYRQSEAATTAAAVAAPAEVEENKPQGVVTPHPEEKKHQDPASAIAAASKEEEAAASLNKAKKPASKAAKPAANTAKTGYDAKGKKKKK